ncbi:39S ribosomal protein L20, mitochondrial-like [Pomacea canaliculata]|uniref:39S ribosomal protein L20, mitochondrial-like n=1 Tax=Pomacea canaliculata TaxID=400727 RepID=UPI000D739A47|nr:39S ribosomal protein L20, mitochondrial-like [Pomacea canaliculata]
MVFLTRSLLGKVSRKPDKYWKRVAIRRLTWHFFGRRRNCYKLSMAVLRRAFRYSSRSARLSSHNNNAVFDTRIAAGCAEHGIQFSSFLSTLYEMNIELGKKVLADFAIYEPRTFQSLCELVKRHYAGSFQKNLNPSNRIFTKGML